MEITTELGWTKVAYSDRLIVVGPEDHERDGADERVEVYTQDASGQWWRTYVAQATNGAPHVTTEKTSGVRP